MRQSSSKNLFVLKYSLSDPSTVQKLHPAIVVQLAKDALEEPASFAKIYVQTIAKMKLHESMDQEQLDELEETLTQLQRVILIT